MLKPQSLEKPLPNPQAARKNRVKAVKPQTYNRLSVVGFFMMVSFYLASATSN